MASWIKERKRIGKTQPGRILRQSSFATIVFQYNFVKCHESLVKWLPFARRATAEFQISSGDELPERPGCANKGISLETNGKPYLNGRFLASITKR